MSDNVCDINFSRSFLWFSTDHSQHTPRLDVDAACTIIKPGGERRQYFLTCECIGEKMYADTGLIHDPVAEFNLIAEPRQQVMLLKRHADGAQDLRSPHRFGDAMPTNDGKGAHIKRLDVRLGRWSGATPITDFQTFHDALHDGVVVNGRTTYTDDDGSQIIMEYPCRTINAHNHDPKWQVDACPVLMTVGGESAHELEVTRLDMASIVFNRFDYAEVVIRRGSASLDGANQYAVRRTLECQSELFAVA